MHRIAPFDISTAILQPHCREEVIIAERLKNAAAGDQTAHIHCGTLAVLPVDFEPVMRFRIERICYRLEFARKSDAVAFADAFGGCLIEDREEVWIDVPIPTITRRARRTVSRRAA